MNISDDDLLANTVKILKMVDTAQTIVGHTDEDKKIETIIFAINNAKDSIEEKSKDYTSSLLQSDIGPIKNQIVELISSASRMTRNNTDMIKKHLENVKSLLTDDEDLKKFITDHQRQMETDKTYLGGIYMFQRFKYNHMHPIIKKLDKYVLKIQTSVHAKEMKELQTQINEARDLIKNKRAELKNHLVSVGLMPVLGGDVKEDEEVFITHIIHNFRPMQSFAGVFSAAATTKSNSNKSNSNNSNSNYEPMSENSGEEEKDNKVEMEIETVIGNNMNVKSGGKRKQTRKRNNKKNKKTKKMKKVKKTMKRKNGKKGKKTSRRRR